MKKRVKKNQVIITALAVMIAVAGYLNYSGMKLEKETAAVSEGTVEDAAAVEEGVDDSSLVDVESWDLALNELETDLGEQEAASTEVAAEEAEGETQSGDTPGEAVLTSVTSGSSFAAEAKLSREQVRAKNKETLLEVINNENITEEQKQSAIDSMTAMTDQAEKEAAAELLLDSKGFVDSVVSITDGTVDVVVNKAELSEAERAQIEDIVKRKTEISGENIVITPRSGE
ncbi:MAG TPA: SpoIIIAH-like family protein [Candidatus Limivivens merdigallinarum]|uniref:SpoIIIAH-like family protein n=1 Tax=Candidatus Limivivens merdigallinarum TaxID=2840859 RepID=A0A9D0ZYP3_9FIRM|nr:SpoIIIAH-like family protein [Candidatus Limivivens merdigallinarum]